MENQDNMAQLNAVLGDWNTNNQNQGQFDPVPCLNKIAELLEKESEEFFKMDPDPLDFRPPGRQIASCGLGKMMKVIFSNGDFMTAIVDSYLLQGSSYRDGSPLFTASCRVLLDLLRDLKTDFFREGVVKRLCYWAEFAEEPLQSYATGLLSGAMELNDVAVKFREESLHLAPIMLDRLLALIEQEKENNSEGGDKQIDEPGQSARHFAVLDSGASTSSNTSFSAESSSRKPNDTLNLKRKLSPSHEADTYPHTRVRTASNTSGKFDVNHSNSSGAAMKPLVIGSYSLSPLTSAMKQSLILQYLASIGDYHELQSPILEHNAMALIFHYINLIDNRDIRLAFEALRFLSVILCHKKCAEEFINKDGIQKLLEIPKPSMAANGVSLCFSHITKLEDNTEQLCMLPETVLSDIVSYNLELMECSHNSSRGYACLFFSQSFTYKVILILFDEKYGLRRLINVINALNIFNTDQPEYENEAKFRQMMKVTRHVCDALCKYFEVHTALKADELRSGTSRLKDSKSVKGCKFTLEENMDILLEHLPPESTWAPESKLHELAGQKILCELLAMLSSEWGNYQGKKETFVSALDVIAMCAVSHQTQLLLRGTVDPPYYTRVSVMSVIVNLAEGKVHSAKEILSDGQTIKAALRVIVNCVCGPVKRFGSGKEDTLSLMWDNVQTNNGIMVLLEILSVKTPITEADWMRMLACKALVGMARSETVRQIIGKLPPLNNLQLQSLMKEPVMSDKRLVHHQFCKYASTLLEKIAGRQANVLGAATLEEIRKAGVIAQTMIKYDKKELLQLIHDHLLSEGLHESAKTVQKEANLPELPTPQPDRLASLHLYSPSTSKIGRQSSASITSVSNQPTRNIFSSVSAPSIAMNPVITLATRSTYGGAAASISSVKTAKASVSTPCMNQGVIRTPLKFTLRGTARHPQSTLHQKNKQRYLKEKDDYVPPGDFLRSKRKRTGDCEISLDKLATEYLRNQHALCPQPISTCPTMSLFIPHRCSQPLDKACAVSSITQRLYDRQVRPPYGGPKGQMLNRRFLHSRDSRDRSRDRDIYDKGFSCCKFDRAGNNIFIGSMNGDVRVEKIASSGNASGAYSTSCHSSSVVRMTTSKVSPDLLITSTWNDEENCALWGFNRQNPDLRLKYRFDEIIANFANQSHDRFIGTKNAKARIYDTSRGMIIQTLYDESRANNYKLNVATFNPTDNLVLNDGNLWDVRTNKMIYKFDKFNQYISGCFHPQGLEVVINSEIWDLRTFGLLHTIPAFDKCRIMFNSNGDVVYALRVYDTSYMVRINRGDYSSTLRAFDALDYSNIGSFELKTKHIYDIDVDRNDLLIAVIQNASEHDEFGREALCRLYELGKNLEPKDQLYDTPAAEDYIYNPGNYDLNLLELDDDDGDDDDDDDDDDD